MDKENKKINMTEINDSYFLLKKIVRHFETIAVPEEFRNLLEKAELLTEKPSTNEKYNLPLATKYSYNRAIEVYQKIQLYEMGIIDKTDFINEVDAIEDTYKGTEFNKGYKSGILQRPC